MADPKRDRKKEYEDYLLDYAIKKGEGQQFEDDVKRGPPYTSRGFAIGHNEDRVERAPPSYAKGGPVGRVGSFGLKRSKPDFAGGGGMQNFKNWSKKNG